MGGTIMGSTIMGGTIMGGTLFVDKCVVKINMGIVEHARLAEQ